MAEFSNTTTKAGLIQRSEALCLLGDTGISANATLLKQFTAYLNEAYYEVWMAQMSANRTWLADDFNYTDKPDATITLVTSQADYTIPVAVASANVATFLRLNGVYTIKNGARTYLRAMEASEDLRAIDGTPSAYRMNGKSITFDVQPSATYVSDLTSFHMEFQRIPDAFLSTDTTQQAGFMETYHDLLPLKASAIYLLPTNTQLATQYEQRFLTRLELFKRDVANLNDTEDRNITSEYIRFR